MFLSTKAYELLLASKNNTVCRKAKFVDLNTIAFTHFEGGKFYKDDRSYIVILFKTATSPARMLKGFYRSNLSNFSETNEVEIHCKNPNLTAEQIEVIDKINNTKFGCCEKRYKLACAAFHLKTDDSLNEANLKVFQAVLDALEPAQAKSATFKLEDFNSEWDLPQNARKAMDSATLNRLRDEATYKYMHRLAKLAMDHDIKSSDVHFAEATQDIPAVPDTPATDDSPPIKGKRAQRADRIWGTGVGINELLEAIKEEGNTDRLYKTVSGYKKMAGEDYTPLYDGKNGLGLSLERAFGYLCGTNYECKFEEMWEFINRIQAFDGFDFFKYEAERMCVSFEPLTQELEPELKSEVKSEEPKSEEPKSEEPKSEELKSEELKEPEFRALDLEPEAKRSCSRETPEPDEIHERSPSAMISRSLSDGYA